MTDPAARRALTSHVHLLISVIRESRSDAIDVRLRTCISRHTRVVESYGLIGSRQRHTQAAARLGPARSLCLSALVASNDQGGGHATII